MKIYILKALFDIPYEYSWYVVILASADEEKVKALKEKLTIEYNEQIKIRQEINKELKKLSYNKSKIKDKLKLYLERDKYENLKDFSCLEIEELELDKQYDL